MVSRMQQITALLFLILGLLLLATLLLLVSFHINPLHILSSSGGLLPDIIFPGH